MIYKFQAGSLHMLLSIKMSPLFKANQLIISFSNSSLTSNQKAFIFEGQ